MKRLLAGVVGGAAALSVIFGAGVASADNEYKGRTFEQVQEWTQGRAVISSRTGSFLPTEQCVVTGNRTATYGNGNSKILVDLNCNDIMTAGHPGYSAATQQGQKAQQLKRTVAFIDGDYAEKVAEGQSPWCEKDFDACKRVCEQSGLCSEELSDYLGI